MTEPVAHRLASGWASVQVDTARGLAHLYLGEQHDPDRDALAFLDARDLEALAGTLTSAARHLTDDSAPLAA